MDRHNRCRKLGVLGSFALALFTSVHVSATDFPRHKLSCEGRDTEYLSFAPATSSQQALPVLLLLHGAGDEAINFIRPWEAMAREKKIILVAPQLPRERNFEPLAPRIFRCVIEDIKTQVHADPQRIYIFGNSMGGYLAYDGALLESNYFAAAAIHAMGIDDDYVDIVTRAKRKIPIAIYMGDSDALVSLPQVRKTRALLEKAGIPVHYREIPHHSHNYYEIPDAINRDVWEFLEREHLP